MERFWSKVNKTDTCWLWTAAHERHGYGVFYFEGRLERAHRWAWIDANGPVPEGLELDHLCRVTACVNPAHLEPVTHSENLRRADWSSLVNRPRRPRQTVCAHGHQREQAATGKWFCRECGREHSRNYRRKVAK